MFTIRKIYCSCPVKSLECSVHIIANPVRTMASWNSTGQAEATEIVVYLPTATLLPEQVGWTFHNVCMKEASTWILPLDMDRC